MMRRVCHWLDRRSHPERYARLAEIVPVLRWTAEDLAAYQRRAFDAMVRHAARESPFYRDSLGAIVAGTPGLVAPDQVPMLRKHDLLANRDDILVRNVEPGTVKTGHTGGSTGTPIAFYYTTAKHELMLAGMMRGFMLSGWRPGQRVLYLWGTARDVNARGVFAAGRADRFAVSKTVAATEFSDARLAEWADLIRAWRPTLLYWYTSVLTALADFLLAAGQRAPASLIGVYATAEMLDESQRERMQRAYGVKVFNQYGCREVPNIAWECRRGGLHVFSDMVQLESVAVDGEDQLVVTSLTDRVFPFIRYALGDTGSLLNERCSCGLPFPLMQTGVCRQNDLIVTSQGRHIHPSYFNQLLYGRTEIHQYQWVQLAVDRLQLSLVSDTAIADDLRTGLERRLRDDLDPSMQVSIRHVDVIPRTSAGKQRFVIGLNDKV